HDRATGAGSPGRERPGRSDHAQVQREQAMKHLAIVGAGGHGRVIADAAQSSGWSAIDFYDDLWPATGANTGAWHVVGNTPLLFERLHDYQGVIVGIGNNLTRSTLQQRLQAAGAPLVSVAHPAAIISS